MTILHRRPLPAPFALLAILALVAGCGTAASPTPPPSTPASSTAPSVPPSQPVDTDEPSEEPSASEDPSGGDLDLEAAAEALEGVDSYKMSITVEGTSAATVEAVIVRGDEPAAHYTTSAEGQVTEIVIIGDEAWVGTAGVFQSVPATSVSGMLSAFDPAVMMSQMNQPGVAESLEEVGEEEKNGVGTTHYHLDADTPGVGLTSFPPGGEFDLWVSEAGYLVALEATGMDANVTLLSIQVTDINSPDNVVEAPE